MIMSMTPTRPSSDSIGRADSHTCADCGHILIPTDELMVDLVGQHECPPAVDEESETAAGTSTPSIRRDTR